MVDSYYQQITEQVLAAQTALQASVTVWATDTVAKMDALAAAATAQLSILDNVDFIPSFVDDLQYVGPTGTKPDYATEPDYSSDGPVAPTLSDPSAISAFSFTDSSYTGLVKTLMTSTINSVLGGNTILPAAVVNAMYDRLLVDLSRMQVAEEWAATDNGASLGWTMPSESTLGAIARAQEITSQKTQEARLEEYVQEWINKQKDMWQGWATGTPHEQAWMSDHHQEQERALKAAIATVDWAIKIYALGLQHDDVKIRIYSQQWDTLSKRIGAAAQMFQARIANTGIVVDSERTRHAYEASRVGKSLDTKRGEVQLEIDRARLVVENTLGTLTTLMQVAANIAMALMAASDVSLGTGTSFGANETHDYKEKCCE